MTTYQIADMHMLARPGTYVVHTTYVDADGTVYGRVLSPSAPVSDDVVAAAHELDDLIMRAQYVMRFATARLPTPGAETRRRNAAADIVKAVGGWAHRHKALIKATGQ